MNSKKLARKARLLRWLMNCYPPYLGAGIRVQTLSPDFRQAQVEMSLRWYNRNYVRTQFGGSLYSMTDPFYMLLIMENLGRDYIVWDKAAHIDFIAPGRGTVYANFSIDATLLDEIRRCTAGGEKHLPELQVEVRDAQGTLVARVHKTLYIRLKPQLRQAA
jgi:acyl-coenzyme A thioesterase PaaI-like protein